MPRDPSKVTLTVYLDPEVKKQWEALAKVRDRSATVETARTINAELERAYETGELQRLDGLQDKENTPSVTYEKAVEVIQATADNGHTRTVAILETARVLGLDGEKLLSACIDAGLKPKNGNGSQRNEAMV